MLRKYIRPTARSMILSSFILGALSQNAMTTPIPLNSHLWSETDETFLEKSSAMISEVEVEAPDGWINFCVRNTADCDNSEINNQFIQLTEDSYKNLIKINKQVNSRLRPQSDIAHNNTIDYWEIPQDNYGDCEDYALMKRKLLIEAGFSKGALLMTIAKLDSGELHAILTVRTQYGDYVLDNLSDDISPWFNRPFKYLKRQSLNNQNIWTALNVTIARSKIANS